MNKQARGFHSNNGIARKSSLGPKKRLVQKLFPQKHRSLGFKFYKTRTSISLRLYHKQPSEFVKDIEKLIENIVLTLVFA